MSIIYVGYGKYNVLYFILYPLCFKELYLCAYASKYIYLRNVVIKVIMIQQSSVIFQLFFPSPLKSMNADLATVEKDPCKIIKISRFSKINPREN